MKFVVLAFLMISIFFSGCSTVEKQKKKPNIIFLFADDQSYETVHALGNEEIKTPALDKLVEEGTVFTHAYNMGAWHGAVCVASRAMLNTGRFVWRAYGYETHQKDLADRGEMWGQLMQKAGYDTYMSGKWHVKTEAGLLFNHTTHIRPGMPNQTPEGYNRPLSPQDTTWRPWDKQFGGYWKGGKHWSEVLGDDALAFIDSAKGKEQPFFMYLAFNAPHDPRQSPKEFVDMYPLENISVPKSFLPEYPFKDSIGCSASLRDEALAPFPRTDYAVKVNRQEYYALITHLDQQIGRILEALEASGEKENTYIFYTADHGLALGNHGLIGKQNMYDHSMRVPLMIVGPDVPKDQKIDADVYLQDLMASALDISGLEKPQYVDFNSLMPFVRGEQTESNYPAIYGCYEKGLQRMIRADGFKLIVYPHGKTMRLYDLTNDPFEMNDLANQPEFSEKKQQLFSRLLDLQKEMEDPLDLATVFQPL